MENERNKMLITVYFPMRPFKDFFLLLLCKKVDRYMKKIIL
jgi:hypothetical protein